MLAQLAAVQNIRYDDDAQHDLHVPLLLLQPCRGVNERIGANIFEQREPTLGH
jgi:hypothetical protein